MAGGGAAAVETMALEAAAGPPADTQGAVSPADAASPSPVDRIEAAKFQESFDAALAAGAKLSAQEAAQDVWSATVQAAREQRAIEREVAAEWAAAAQQPAANFREDVEAEQVAAGVDGAEVTADEGVRTANGDQGAPVGGATGKKRGAVKKGLSSKPVSNRKKSATSTPRSSPPGANESKRTSPK